MYTNNVDQLDSQIECARASMFAAYNKYKNFLHSEVIKRSEDLDQLINIKEKMMFKA